MNLNRFSVPDHDQTGVLFDVGRRFEDSAFGADYDRSFIEGVGLKNQCPHL
jgi:hypothetical protein